MSKQQASVDVLEGNKLKFRLSKKYNDSELFKHFGQYARYVFGMYAITFNGKDFFSDNPSDLFDKVKKEYNDYVSKS